MARIDDHDAFCDVGRDDDGDGSDEEEEEDDGGGGPKNHEAQEEFECKRRKRLELNRKAAQESRRRKKLRIEELQRSVVFLTRENSELREQNELLRQMLANELPVESTSTMDRFQAENAALKLALYESVQTLTKQNGGVLGGILGLVPPGNMPRAPMGQSAGGAPASTLSLPSSLSQSMQQGIPPALQQAFSAVCGMAPSAAAQGMSSSSQQQQQQQQQQQGGVASSLSSSSSQQQGMSAALPVASMAVPSAMGMPSAQQMKGMMAMMATGRMPAMSSLTPAMMVARQQSASAMLGMASGGMSAGASPLSSLQETASEIDLVHR